MLSTPEFLQTKEYDAQDMRYMLRGLITEGVSPGELAVTQRAAGANMSVDVSAGRAWVEGDDTARQGIYHVFNDDVVNKTIPAADASLPRVDRVVLQIRDTTFGAAADDAQIDVVQGTPTSGATLTNLSGAAAVPNSALLLANVLVGAADTSITNAEIQTFSRALQPSAVALEVADPAAWTNMPAAVTELLGTAVNRRGFDLSAVTEARLVAQVVVAGASAATLRAQYSLDGTTWAFLSAASGPQLALGTTALRRGAWESIVAAARTDVYLRVVGQDGDAVADPDVANLQLQVR